MKQKLLTNIALWMLTGISPCILNATDFSYKHQGQTITYTILDEEAKTVKTKDGNAIQAGNFPVGSLTLPETVYYNNEPYTLTAIGSDAFRGCVSLTSVVIPNTVTALGVNAFYGCEKLLNVTLSDSLTELADYSFYGCSYLSNITLPGSLTAIGNYAFYDCKRLKDLVLPNSVSTIGASAFRGCSGLVAMTMPKSVNSIGDYAFNGCTGLISFEREETQTTIFGEVKKNDEVKGDVEAFARLHSTTMNGKYRFTDLMPGNSFAGFSNNYDVYYGISCNGINCDITSVSVSTKYVTVMWLGKSTTATTAVIVPSVNNGDAKIAEEYWDGIAGNPSGRLEVTGLNPNESYTFRYVVKGESGWKIEQTETVKTKELELITQPGEAMNLTTALLSAKTNISEIEENVGFEWRRYDAPETLPSQKVMCAVIDGTLMGALGNLNPEVYYNYRPFYTSDSGRTFYGSWVTVFTGDANVFFDPTVRTYSTTNVGQSEATLRGYALRGSDDIKRQGFQYWIDGGGTSRAASEVVEVEVPGLRLSYLLNGLKSGTTYSYRAFVETAGGFTYGDTVSFTTKGDASGIDEVESDASTQCVAVEYWNLQGIRSDKPYRGINIVRYSDGTVRKEVR